MQIRGAINYRLPAALTSVTYDAANQLTSWAGIAPAYDADGNMTVDVNGNHYAWNSRNQLTGITGANSATFSYDGLGRRATKQIGSVATTFQYDGWNRIAETSAGATATLLPGALDEYFLRTDGNGAMVPVTDALGSTRGLVNSSGQVATSDWYDPYGNMTTTGAATANSTTYTGRESDGDGLLFYRARYYNPSTGRFIDEDPSGFAGGDLDLYRYVENNPISSYDPMGLSRKGGKWPGGWGIPGGWGVPGGWGLPGLPGPLGDPNDPYDPDDPNNDPCANEILDAAGVSAEQQIATVQTYILNSTGAFGDLAAYAAAVETGGPNDIKNLPGHSPQNPIDVAAGNISYGITCPFGAAFCQFAAGVAQTMAGSPDFNGTLATGFDSPSDNAQIQIGQGMRAAGCHE